MIDPSQNKKIRQFVRQKFGEICYFESSKQLILKRIIRIITVSDFGGIVGEYGTGRRQIVDEIIGPALNEFYGLFLKSKYALNNNNQQLDNVLSGKSGKVLFISEYEPLLLVDEHLSPTLRLIQERLTDHDILRLLSLQQQYLDYPEIIAKIVEQECGIPINRILIDISGCIESMISGMSGNYQALRKLIMTEVINIDELKEEEKPPKEQVGLYLRFNSYFDTLPRRKEIWRSFWHSSNSVHLAKIQKFNREYKKNVQEAVRMASSGPFRKHPQEVFLNMLKEYCRALILYFNKGSIEDAVTQPIDKKISQLINLTDAIPNRIGWLYCFTAEKPSPKSSVSNISKEDDNSLSSIFQYNAIEIRIPRGEIFEKKCDFRLTGENENTKYVKMDPIEASLLYYLALERRAEEEDWLIKPEEHQDEIKKICDELELEEIYYNEYSTVKKPDDPKTWIWDFRNNKRRFIVSHLNTKLKNMTSLSDPLICSRPGSAPRKGNYALAKHIYKVKIITV